MMYELCLLSVNVKSLPLWDEIRDESVLGLTWWEENWRQPAGLITRTLKATLTCYHNVKNIPAWQFLDIRCTELEAVLLWSLLPPP